MPSNSRLELHASAAVFFDVMQARPACFGELALKNTQPRAATVKFGPCWKRHAEVSKLQSTNRARAVLQKAVLQLEMISGAEMPDEMPIDDLGEVAWLKLWQRSVVWPCWGASCFLFVFQPALSRVGRTHLQTMREIFAWLPVHVDLTAMFADRIDGYLHVRQHVLHVLTEAGLG